MDCSKIGLIIIGILATIICLGLVFCGIAMIVAAPLIGKIFGAVVFVLMALFCAGILWFLILES